MLCYTVECDISLAFSLKLQPYMCTSIKGIFSRCPCNLDDFETQRVRTMDNKNNLDDNYID